MLCNYFGFVNCLGFKELKWIFDINEFFFDLVIEDFKGLNYLFDLKLGWLKDIDLSGCYNGNSDLFIFYLEVLSIIYGNLWLVDVYVYMDVFKNEGDLDIVVDFIIINGKLCLNIFIFLSIL